MREKGQTEAAETLETPVFSRGIEILTEKNEFFCYGKYASIHTMSSIRSASARLHFIIFLPPMQ